MALRHRIPNRIGYKNRRYTNGDRKRTRENETGFGGRAALRDMQQVLREEVRTNLATTKAAVVTRNKRTSRDIGRTFGRDDSHTNTPGIDSVTSSRLSLGEASTN